MAYQWTTGSLETFTRNLGFNGVRSIRFNTGSLGDFTPQDGDLWLSGSEVFVRITGSNYKFTLTAAE